LLLVAIIIIAISQSLGALVGLVVLALAYSVKTRNPEMLVVGAVAVVSLVPVMSLVFPVQATEFVQRAFAAAELDESADSDRVARLPSNIDVWTTSPAFGHGLGTNHIVEPRGLSSGWMQLLIERGLFGGALYIAPFAFVCLILWKVKGETSEVRDWALLHSVLSLYILNTFAMIYFQPFWFSFGIALSAVRGMNIRDGRGWQVLRWERGASLGGRV
jgi:hypothetical protein